MFKVEIHLVVTQEDNELEAGRAMVKLAYPSEDQARAGAKEILDMVCMALEERIVEPPLEFGH